MNFYILGTNNGDGQGQYSGSQYLWGTNWSDVNPDYYSSVPDYHSREPDEEPIYDEPDEPDDPNQTLVKAVVHQAHTESDSEYARSPDQFLAPTPSTSTARQPQRKDHRVRYE